MSRAARPCRAFGAVSGAPDLGEQNAGKMKGIWLIGVSRQHLVVERPGILRTSCLMIGERLPQQFLGLVRGQFGRGSGTCLTAAFLAIHDSAGLIRLHRFSTGGVCTVYRARRQLGQPK